MIVDLAVGRDPERSIRVTHRLARRVGAIDDRESPMPEPDSTIRRDSGPRPIRAAMGHRIAHPNDCGLIDGPTSREKSERSDYSTHLTPRISLRGPTFNQRVRRRGAPTRASRHPNETDLGPRSWHLARLSIASNRPVAGR